MFSEKVTKALESSSWIRAMFEKGAELAKIHGAENVYDFSLGNPFDEPPKEVQEALKKYVSGEVPGIHRYMNNAGFPEVRAKLARQLTEESGVPLTADHVIMTVGAAGGLNVVFKALLNPWEEVIVFAPYFVEYNAYVDNHGGKTVVVPADTATFEPNVKAMEDMITARTKAIIINNPNNPSGVVYSQETLQQIQQVLAQKEKEYGTTIYVVSDEPYAKIVYDGVTVPNLLSIFPNGIIVNSYSKSLGLAGERIGYIAVHSGIQDVSILLSALTYCNRILGFVNAPGLFQKVIADSLDAKVNVEDYREKRDVLYQHLTQLGFRCVRPQGAFYLFPQSPIEDELAFVNEATKHNILLVPGRGFGCPGYVRLSYCVGMDTIRRSLPAFEKLAKVYFG